MQQETSNKESQINDPLHITVSPQGCIYEWPRVEKWALENCSLYKNLSDIAARNNVAPHYREVFILCGFIRFAAELKKSYEAQKDNSKLNKGE